MEPNGVLWHWKIIYDVLKNHYKDGRHFADPDHVRNGFIALYDHATQLETENERLKEAWAKFKRWAENKRRYEESGGDPEYEAYLAKERAEAEAMLEAI